MIRSLLLIIVAVCGFAHAEEKVKTPVKEINSFSEGPASVWIRSEYPFAVGPTASYDITDTFALGVGAGWTPKQYAKDLGATIDWVSESQGFKYLIEHLFDTNVSCDARVEYRPYKQSHWSFEAGGIYLDMSTEAPITEALEASTGRDFTRLKDLLAIVGKQPVVAVSSKVFLLELRTNYRISLGKGFETRLGLGLIKTLSADVHISSHSTAFDNSAAGKNLYDLASTAIEEFFFRYGYVPVAGVEVGYRF
ncbi:MAG: hypothetical protein ABL958_05130 [Bdellovibrionia bacterium]